MSMKLMWSACRTIGKTQKQKVGRRNTAIEFNDLFAGLHSLTELLTCVSLISF